MFTLSLILLAIGVLQIYLVQTSSTNHRIILTIIPVAISIAGLVGIITHFIMALTAGLLWP